MTNFSALQPRYTKEQRRKKNTAIAQSTVEGAANGGGIGIGAGYVVRKSAGGARKTLATSLRREKTGFVIGTTLGGIGNALMERGNQYPKAPGLKKPRMIKPKAGGSRNANG